MMALLFIVRDLWVIVVMFFAAFFAGMFGLSCEILSDLDGIVCLLGVLFFPVLMILGIGKAFGEFFCEPVGEILQDFCQIASEGMESICNI